MWRLLEAGRIGAAAFQRMDLLLERTVVRDELLNLALLAHDDGPQMLQRAFEMGELGLDGFESTGFSHGARVTSYGMQ